VSAHLNVAHAESSHPLEVYFETIKRLTSHILSSTLVSTLVQVDIVPLSKDLPYSTEQFTEETRNFRTIPLETKWK
jgi:hypothetical protein